MANPVSYLFAGPPEFRCDGCGSIHLDESKALACCNSPMTECGITEVDTLTEVDISMVPCWYLEEAGQLRLF